MRTRDWRDAIGRLSRNPKAASAISDIVPPTRIEPSPRGSLSRILKEGVPAAWGESDAASVTA